MEEEQEVSVKKYYTATLNKVNDAEMIGRFNRLNKIGGFSAADVFRAGVDALAKSEPYQNALRALKKELEK